MMSYKGRESRKVGVVWVDEKLVTLPGTSFNVTYERSSEA